MGRLAKYLLVTIAMVLSGIAAQSQDQYFGIQLKEVTDPTTQAIVKFIPALPETATLVKWEFGQGGATSTEESPEYTYSISLGGDEFTVSLVYSIDGVQSTYTQTIKANSAFFVVRLDKNLDSLATFKRILTSAFRFADNLATGNMRFEWSIDGVQPTNASYPNLYYTFPNGGTYIVNLKAWNIDDATKSVEYSETVTIKPVFGGATKIQLENIPNVFTPNGDGINDFFAVQTSGLSRMVLRVFTRSGALVHENTANVIQWDGKNQMGNDLPEGIYFYVIEDLDNNYETAKGFVYILKGNN